MFFRQISRFGGLFLFVCLFCQPASAQSDETVANPAPTASGQSLLLSIPAPDLPDTRTVTQPRQQLQLNLDNPLGIQTRFFSNNIAPQTGLVLAASSLNYQLNEQLSLAGNAMAGEQVNSFTSLGSIQCENGTLDAVSYRASNCHFVDDSSTIRADTVSIGGRYQISDTTSASLSLYQTRQRTNSTYQPGNDSRLALDLDPFNPGSAVNEPLFSLLDPGSGLQRLNSELTGIDLQFQVGLSTDSAGDLVVGLQLTRVLDSDVEGAFYSLPGIQNWSLAEPFDSARLSLGWNRGAFSGGVQTYYRSAVEFLNQQSLDERASFDVHFTWRAPWNASLSVGASNVLNAGPDNTGPSDGQLTDPFESIYGRIPYVRYKQDL